MARGSLTSSPGNGKKIATLPYDVEQEADGKIVSRKLSVDLYMKSSYGKGEGADKEVIGAKFLLLCEDFKVEGSDIDACIKTMRGNLDRKYAIKWEPWLLVRVLPMRIYRGDGAGTELSWNEVWRGVTLDGDILLREFDHHAVAGNHWKVSPWPQTFKDPVTGKVVSCVPKTEDNVEALELFAAKLKELTRTLGEFVAPDRIDETLEMIASGGLKLLGNT